MIISEKIKIITDLGLLVFFTIYFIEVIDIIQKIGYIEKRYRESDANEYA